MLQEVSSTKTINKGDKVVLVRGDTKLEGEVQHKTPSGRLNVVTAEGFSLQFMPRGIQHRAADRDNPFKLYANLPEKTGELPKPTNLEAGAGNAPEKEAAPVQETGRRRRRRRDEFDIMQDELTNIQNMFNRIRAKAKGQVN